MEKRIPIVGAIDPREMIQGLRRALDARGVDHKRVIQSLGQVSASVRRSQGDRFLFRDHLRGLILAQMSNQRSWGPVAAQLGRLEEIFAGFDPKVLRTIDPEILTERVLQIRCGNRCISSQMNALSQNIATLERIGKRYGSLDIFVEHQSPACIATLLGSAGPWKLKMVGFALAMEYLKNVGILAAKPDVHMRRILGPERLGFFQYPPNAEEAADLIFRFAKRAQVSPVYLDNLLWLFCAKDYGRVCGAEPQCAACPFRQRCRHWRGQRFLPLAEAGSTFES